MIKGDPSKIGHLPHLPFHSLIRFQYQQPNPRPRTRAEICLEIQLRNLSSLGCGMWQAVPPQGLWRKACNGCGLKNNLFLNKGCSFLKCEMVLALPERTRSTGFAEYAQGDCVAASKEFSICALFSRLNQAMTPFARQASKISSALSANSASLMWHAIRCATTLLGNEYSSSSKNAFSPS